MLTIEELATKWKVSIRTAWRRVKGKGFPKPNRKYERLQTRWSAGDVERISKRMGW